MKKYCIILTTWGGRKYGRRIGKELRKLNVTSFYCSLNRWPKVLDDHPELNKDNCVILARAAHPNNSPEWMKTLENLEELGWKVINSTKVLMLTSNKLACSLFLQDKVNHPKTWECTKNTFANLINELPKGDYIVKPYVSQSQGKYVQRFHIGDDVPDKGLVNIIPENKLVIQERIKYVALYRVIVINGKALPYSFVDRPNLDKWKCSVCLNKDTMEYVPNPNPDLLKLGEETQKVIGGDINYIDIFEDWEGKFIISEINTSCVLRIHERLSGKNIAQEIAMGVKELL